MMTNPNALVDGISGLTAPTTPRTALTEDSAQQQITVNFQGGRSGVLDPANPRSPVWADVLQSLHQADKSVYVEIDPDTNTITEVLIPLTVKVESLNSTATGDAIEVELLISHARHYLRRNHPNFQQLLATLEAAQAQDTTVLVTETRDEHEIIDVRPSPKQLAEERASPPPEITPRTLIPVTLQKAQEIFNLLKAQTCSPLGAPSTCIPFMYPDDGCWGRAHEMCRLMIDNGVQPQKVWIYAGSVLRAATQNNPACEVRWGWHVAPTLLVSTGSTPEIYVIDPSLFLAPVRQSVWFDVQGDPSATLVPSDASVFYRGRSGNTTYDPNYTETQQVLTTYRNELKLRSTSSVGAPPYSSCVWKVKAIAARCLSKNPPILVKRDIYNGTSPQTRTLRQQLAVILSHS